MAGDIDLGPYIVALSPHRVVAAPYHRLEQGILANHAIMDGTPEQVREATTKCLIAGGGQRHIVNLSHGCDRAMPVANFEAFVQTARGSPGPPTPLRRSDCCSYK